jgi:ribosomal protein S18 acetylase RimI-like enzyme
LINSSIFLTLSKCALTTRRILAERDTYVPDIKLNEILISPLILRKGVYELIQEKSDEITEIMIDCGSFLVQQGRLSYSELLSQFPYLYRKFPTANWYVLPDQIPIYTDSDKTVERKVTATVHNAIKFAGTFGDSLSGKLIPVVHGRYYSQFDKCIRTYSSLPIRRIGFGSLVTNGPSYGINSMSRSTVDNLINIVTLANRHNLEVHVFGVSSPIQLLICEMLGVASVDSSAWNRIAGYGLIYLPYLKSFYVSGGGRKSPLYRINKLRSICTKYLPSFSLLPEEVLEHSMYSRSLQNWLSLRFMNKEIDFRSPLMRECIATLSPRNYLLLKYAINHISQSTIIRKATIDDLQPIYDLVKQHYKELGFVLNSEINEAIKRGHVIVADLFSKVVGFQEYRHLKYQEQTTLYHKAVSSKYRRYGIGTKLVDFVVSEATSFGKKLIVVKCVSGLDANEFHLKYGFKFARTEKGKRRPVNVYHLCLTQMGGIK